MRISYIFMAMIGLTVSAAGRAQDSDVAKQLADAQDKLNTSLHSYSILMDENTKLKADADQAATEKAALQAQLDSAKQTIENLKAAAAAAAQLEPLRNQLRQTQDQLTDMAQQNYELKNRLAQQGSAPAAPVAAAPASKSRNP